MLSVNNLNSLCGDAVTALSQLKAHYLIITESHLSKRLKAHKASQSPFLVAVMPSAQSSAPNEDALSWQNELMFLFLTKPLSYTARKIEDEAADFQLTQSAALAFIEHLRQKQHTDCHFLRRLNLNELALDPEYNMHSCDGWSLTLNLRTS